METLGPLTDKYTILRVRQSFMDPKDEAQPIIARMITDTKAEMARFRIRVQEREGTIDRLEVCQPKLKNYAHQDNRLNMELMNKSFEELEDMLYAANLKLWELEDVRRDKSLPSLQRLEACDQVCVFNKARNELIDIIDEKLYSELLSTQKREKNQLN